MKHGFLKVATAAPHVTVADCSANVKEMISIAQAAYADGVRLLVFPELCITGYTCGDLFLQEILLEEAKNQLVQIAEATTGKDAIVIVGLPLERDGRLYNVAAIMQNGMVLGLVPKANIPSYAEFYEGRHFTEGNREVVSYCLEGEKIPFGVNLLFECANMRGLVIGCEICEDLWVAKPPSTEPRDT